MDEILAEFLEEASEALEALESSLGRFGDDPAGAGATAYRSVHLIRGASGFLGLPRMARLSAAGETLFSRLESGAVAAAPERLKAARKLHTALKELVLAVEREGGEPAGDDGSLVALIEGAATIG